MRPVAPTVAVIAAVAGAGEPSVATSPNASATVIDSPGSGGREVRSRARSSARIAAADSGRSAGSRETARSNRSSSASWPASPVRWAERSTSVSSAGGRSPVSIWMPTRPTE